MALINCPECGKEISDAASNCPHCGFPIEDYLNGVKIIPEEQTNQPINLGKVKNDSHRTTKMFSNMKTWKLVSGIISMLLFAFVTFQSCAIGIANTIEENEEIKKRFMEKYNKYCEIVNLDELKEEYNRVIK